MKVAKLELRSVNVGEKEPITYAGLVKTVISAPGPSGLTCDELLLSVALQTEVNAAVEKKAPHVLLNDEQSAFLKSKLEAFRWGVGLPAFAEFVQYVRKLPTVEVEAKP